MYEGIVPTPDQAFMDQLKGYYKGLECEFDREKERFVIYENSPNIGKHEIIVVQTEDGEFRQPDERDIGTIFFADRHRTDNEWKDFIEVGEKLLEEYDEKYRTHVRSELRDTTKENKIQLINTYGRALNLGGKFNSTFRRVETTPPEDARIEKRDGWTLIDRTKRAANA